MTTNTASVSTDTNAQETAIKTIMREHLGLWHIIGILEQLQQEMNLQDTPPDVLLIRTIFDYFEHFSNRVHSGPQEVLLYQRLNARCDDAREVIAKLEIGYQRGHDQLQQLRQLLETCAANFPEGRDTFSYELTGFILALRKHIKKEEGVIIPKARQYLTEEDWQAILHAKDQHQDPLFGARVREEFKTLRHRIVSLTPENLGGLGLAHTSPTSVVSKTSAAAPLLQLENINASYGRIQVLHSVNIEIQRGELVALVGANGAGKTTLLRTLSGLHQQDSGRILFASQDMQSVSADQRVHSGIVQVPEGRQVFKALSVEDNIQLGAYSRKDSPEAIRADLEHMYETFPILRQKRLQAAGTLSGGQQQMLAMARALMARPKLLLLDEPSMGLAPLIVEEIFNIVSELKRQGMTIFLVEQNAAQALALADRGYVLETGEVVLSGAGADLLKDEKVKEAYLGI